MPAFILPLAIPGAQELLTIFIVVVILLVIIAILNIPQIQVPDPFKRWAIWIVSGIIVVYLVWTALKIAGIL